MYLMTFKNSYVRVHTCGCICTCVSMYIQSSANTKSLPHLLSMSLPEAGSLSQTQSLFALRDPDLCLPHTRVTGEPSHSLMGLCVKPFYHLPVFWNLLSSVLCFHTSPLALQVIRVIFFFTNGSCIIEQIIQSWSFFHRWAFGLTWSLPFKNRVTINIFYRKQVLL